MSQSKIVTEPGKGTLEIFPLSTDTDFLQTHDYMTVFLPNPYMSVEREILKEPRWEHLAMWDHLRKTYLGLEPDLKDHTASRQLCG